MELSNLSTSLLRRCVTGLAPVVLAAFREPSNSHPFLAFGRARSISHAGCSQTNLHSQTVRKRQTPGPHASGAPSALCFAAGRSSKVPGPCPTSILTLACPSHHPSSGRDWRNTASLAETGSRVAFFRSHGGRAGLRGAGRQRQGTKKARDMGHSHRRLHSRWANIGQTWGVASGIAEKHLLGTAQAAKYAT